MKLDLPSTIRDLESELVACGFERIDGRSSHRKWRHAMGVSVVFSAGRADANRATSRDVRRAIAIVEGVTSGLFPTVPAPNPRTHHYDPVVGEEDLYDAALVRAGRVKAPAASEPAPTPEPPVDRIFVPIGRMPADLPNMATIALLHTFPSDLWAPTPDEARENAEIQWGPSAHGDGSLFMRKGGDKVYRGDGGKFVGQWSDGAWIDGVDRRPIEGNHLRAWIQWSAIRKPVAVWMVGRGGEILTTIETNRRADIEDYVTEFEAATDRQVGSARADRVAKAARSEAIAAAPPNVPAPAPRAAPTGGCAFYLSGSDWTVLRLIERRTKTAHSPWEIRFEAPGERTRCHTLTASEAATHEDRMDAVRRAAAEHHATICGVASGFARLSFRTQHAGIAVEPYIGRNSVYLGRNGAVIRASDLWTLIDAFRCDPQAFGTWAASGPTRANELGTRGWPSILSSYRMDASEKRAPDVAAAVPVGTNAGSLIAVPEPTRAATSAPETIAEPAPIEIAAPAVIQTAKTDPRPAEPSPISEDAPIVISREARIAVEALREELDTPAVRLLLGREVTLSDVLKRVIMAGVAAIRADLASR